VRLLEAGLLRKLEAGELSALHALPHDLAQILLKLAESHAVEIIK
jgi:hypothetical protein